MNGERIQAESFIAHGWFEAVFQKWRTNGYTCENCSCFQYWYWDGVCNEKTWSYYHKEREVVKREGIKPPNCRVMKEIKKEGYTYLGIIESDKIKEDEME